MGTLEGGGPDSPFKLRPSAPAVTSFSAHRHLRRCCSFVVTDSNPGGELGGGLGAGPQFPGRGSSAAPGAAEGTAGRAPWHRRRLRGQLRAAFLPVDLVSSAAAGSAAPPSPESAAARSACTAPVGGRAAGARLCCSGRDRWRGRGEGGLSQGKGERTHGDVGVGARTSGGGGGHEKLLRPLQRPGLPVLARSRVPPPPRKPGRRRCSEAPRPGQSRWGRPLRGGDSGEAPPAPASGFAVQSSRRPPRARLGAATCRGSSRPALGPRTRRAPAQGSVPPDGASELRASERCGCASKGRHAGPAVSLGPGDRGGCPGQWARCGGGVSRQPPRAPRRRETPLRRPLGHAQAGCWEGAFVSGEEGGVSLLGQSQPEVCLARRSAAAASKSILGPCSGRACLAPASTPPPGWRTRASRCTCHTPRPPRGTASWDRPLRSSQRVAAWPCSSVSSSCASKRHPATVGASLPGRRRAPSPLCWLPHPLVLGTATSLLSPPLEAVPGSCLPAPPPRPAAFSSWSCIWTELPQEAHPNGPPRLTPTLGQDSPGSTSRPPLGFAGRSAQQVHFLFQASPPHWDFGHRPFLDSPISGAGVCCLTGLWPGLTWALTSTQK